MSSKQTRRVTLVLDEDIYEFLVCYAREISRAEIKPMMQGGVSEAARRLLRNQHSGRTLSEALRRWLRKRMEVEISTGVTHYAAEKQIVRSYALHDQADSYILIYLDLTI